MFGRKPTSNSNRPASSNRKNLSQLGLLDIPDMTNIDDLNNFDDGDEDSDLEAELLALTKGNVPKAKKKPATAVNPNELNKMIQESLRDIPSDEDVSSGEDNPDLMAELKELQSDEESPSKLTASSVNTSTNPTKQLLEERLKMYQTAEQNAKSSNDTMKAKRMARGITSLKDLLRKANTGQKINEDDIPPVVSLGVTKPAPAPSLVPEAPSNPPETVPSVSQVTMPSPSPIVTFPESPEEEEEQEEEEGEEEGEEEASPEEPASPVLPDIIELLTQRQNQYKTAAVVAKKNGDSETALKYVRVYKGFGPVIDAVKQGATIDLNSLPPVPSVQSPVSVVQLPATPSPVQRRESETQRSQAVDREAGDIQSDTRSSTVVTALEANSELPKTLLEALQMRLKLFQDRAEVAKRENDARKVRTNERIIKQFQDAIKLHKAGKPIPVDELPTPPGFPPLPVNDSAPTAPPTPPARSPKSETVSPQEPNKPSVISPNQGHSAGFVSRNEKQLQLVLKKQREFKAAALKAKQEGDIEQAKEYLRVVKGIDPMIEASMSGLPIDLSSLPLLPEERKLMDERESESTRLTDTMEATDLNVLHKLETDLQHQIELCTTTRDHFKAIGDIANANRLDQLALKSKNDLKLVQLAYNNESKIPKFRYESRTFTTVQCNTELTDNDVEVTVVQGVNYNVPNPKEIDTYVKLIFPYPAETPQQFKSGVIYDTNNPTYDAVAVFNIQRNARACQRIFKRQALKCEIWSRGGFFRSDSLIGTANVKLQPLETHCIVHDAFDLMDGRRAVGGKVEIKIKIRDPILRKQLEKVEEKWLVIDV